jgi:hypothetical protein
VFFVSLPLWQGHLIFKQLFTTLPGQYIDAIHTLNALPSGKIADFPQDCAEGWYNQQWGYFGSGFLWYGLKDPVMARAFDVWSPHNENYYWEVTSALHRGDYTTLENIFTKYGVRYILFDQNTTHCKSTKSMLTSLDFLEYIKIHSNYKQVNTFSDKFVLPISIFERTNYVPAPTAIPSDAIPNIMPSYAFGDRDLGLSTLPYMSDASVPATIERQTQHFSKRGDPLTPEDIKQLDPQPIATISASMWEKVPCRTKPENTNVLSLAYPAVDLLRLLATQTDTCVAYTIEGINTSLAYTLRIQSNHIAGEPLQLSVTNKGRPIGMSITVPTHSTITKDVFYLAPSFQNETSYTITLKTPSYNRYTSINDIGNINLERIENMREISNQSTSSAKLLSVKHTHPFSGLYTIPYSNNAENNRDIIMIDQSFNKGWIAISAQNIFPYFHTLPHHILINNWQNGWNIANEDAEAMLIIFFWPQLLEWTGLAILLFTLLYTGVKSKNRLH